MWGRDQNFYFSLGCLVASGIFIEKNFLSPIALYWHHLSKSIACRCNHFYLRALGWVGVCICSESLLPGHEGIRLVLSPSVFQMGDPPSAKIPGHWPFPSHLCELLLESFKLQSNLGFVIEYLRHILTTPWPQFHYW